MARISASLAESNIGIHMPSVARVVFRISKAKMAIMHFFISDILMMPAKITAQVSPTRLCPYFCAKYIKTDVKKDCNCCAGRLHGSMY